ncbi:ABC1 family, putative [Leishmania lindenbergi]|uniref:ABC1 family n=1 Tax=Leishmania lindenbergi TaxID=651832 RepID=A0AAW3ASL0_9TRYP
MSGNDMRRRVTALSRRQVRIFGAVATGCCGLGLYGCYSKFFLPEYLREDQRRRMPMPVRRTKLYIAGTSMGDGLLPEVRSMPKVVFFFYVAYRVVLLFVGCVPVLWYGFLTYSLGLCPEQIFYEKMLAFLSSMGPSYIKFGQWMATRPDFFPNQMCKTLEKLYDSTEPHKWSHTEKSLRRVFTDGPCKGHNALRYISEIEKVPIKSGSIAQIHRAKLRESIDGIPAGTELALKVTHPHIREQVSADLAAMRLFVWVGNRIIPGLRYFNLDASINEFSSLVQSQLNLLVEADNLMQFRYNFRSFNGVIFPTPLMSLSTEDVLFETFEEGVPLHNVMYSEEYRGVAELGCHMFFKMLFEDNFVHSDLHPGNVFLRTNKTDGVRQYYPDGKRKLRFEVVVLDTGLVTTLSRDERNNFISLFAAVACGDGELGADLMIDRLPHSMRDAQDPVNRERFKQQMKQVFDLVSPEAAGFRLSKVQIGTVLGKIMETVRENHIPLDGNFASLVLSVIVGEGLGRKLLPDFNIFAEAAPYLIAFLEDGELFFLANKLQGTYGATALLRDSVDIVRPSKVGTYAEMAVKKGEHMVQKFFTSDKAHG